MADNPSIASGDSPEPTTRAKLSKTEAFALTSDHLKRINMAASKVVPIPPKLEAICSDGVTREFSSFEKLLEYDNASTRQLDVILITAVQRSPMRRKLMLRLGGKPRNVLGEVMAEESIREIAIREVLDVLKDAQPWYAPIACYFTSLYWTVAIAPLILTFILMCATSAQLVPDNFKIFLILFQISIVDLLLALILLSRAYKLKSYLFPVSVILTGAGKDRDKKREIWRQISVGVAIALFVGLIVGLLIEFWLHR